MEAKQLGYVHLVLKFRMSGSVPSLFLYTLMHRDNFTFNTSSDQINVTVFLPTVNNLLITVLSWKKTF